MFLPFDLAFVGPPDTLSFIFSLEARKTKYVKFRPMYLLPPVSVKWVYNVLVKLELGQDGRTAWQRFSPIKQRFF